MTEGARLPHLSLIGCGLRALDHLTREADRCLAAARVVFHSIYSRGLAVDLATRAPQARLLAQEDGEYLVGQYRPDMYRRIADRALDEACRGPGVVVLHPGSVVVVDAIARRLLARGAELGLDVAVLPGISSIEFVLAALGWDPAAGLQVMLAQNLVLHRRRLDPTQAAIVLQPGYYDSRWFAGAPLSRPGRFDALHRQLAASHPPEAPMALVLAPIADGDGDAARVLWFRRDRLPALAPAIGPLHTLFIPPVDAPGVDPEFAARIDSWDALLGQTEADPWGSPRQDDPRRWFAAADAIGPELRADADRLAAAWPQTRARLLDDGLPAARAVPPTAGRAAGTTHGPVANDSHSRSGGGGRGGGGRESDRRREAYARDGYLLVRDAFDADVLDAMRALITRQVDDYALELRARGRIDDLRRDLPFDRRLAAILGPAGIELRKWNAFLFCPEVHALAGSPRLVEALVAVVGPEVVFHGDYQLTPKLPGSRLTAFPWHQDTLYYGRPSQHLHIVTVWLPLVDADEVNGCLHLIPGSHRWGLLDGSRDADMNIHPHEDVTTRGRPLPMPMRCGDALLISNLTFHASHVNRSDRVRWSMDLGYSAAADPATTTPEQEASRRFVFDALRRAGRTPLRVASADASRIERWSDWERRHGGP